MNSNNLVYPGNRDLPTEVKDRVFTTFRHTADLFRQGRIDDVEKGCSLILQMDPAFVPARKLLEKLRNPAAPVDIDALTAGLSGGEDRLVTARQALVNRDFRRAVELASEVLRADLTNEEAQQIGNEAQERLEAAPFVEQFLGHARTRLASGNLAGARSDIDKARALDADHPMIRQIENTLATMPVNASATHQAPTPSSTEPPFPEAGFASDQGSRSSFIVDADAPPARSSQASDFGFSFEEERSATGSFDFAEPPAEPAAPPEVDAGFPMGQAQGFDFSTAPAEASNEDKERIEQYLQDGDQAAAAGDYQRATEIWSRIFLIDVTHPQASERIENARNRQLEIDHKVDSIQAEAQSLLAEGKNDEARTRFEEILRLDPGHEAAAAFLDSGTAPATAFQLPSEPPRTDEESHRTEEDLAAAYGISLEMPANDMLGSLQPPEPSPATTGPAGAVRPSSRRGGVLVVIGALLLLLAAGYFGYTKFFTGKDPGAGSQNTELILIRAQALAKQGRYDQGIALLSSIGPKDPQRDRALALIAEIRNQKAAGPATVDGRPALEVFQELLQQGQIAFAARDFIQAKAFFQRAASIRPLPAEVRPTYQSALQQVAKLDSALALFKEGNYGNAIDVLQGLSQSDPENLNIRQLLNNAHFNLGVIALREENLEEAIAQFDSVLQTSPADEQARRSRDIAARYQTQQKDLLFRIYVKYLPLR